MLRLMTIQEFIKESVELGEHGWELIAVTKGTSQYDYHYFKRELK